MDPTAAGLSTRLQTWLGKPFSEDMSLMGWALFTILIASITFAWTRVLDKI